MKIIKNVIQYILVIILIFMSLAYFVIALSTNTILKKQYIISQIESSEYYNKIYEEAKSNFEKYIEQSGFEATILENVISKEKIKNDTNIIINNIYDGTNEEIDTQEIRDKINQNILQSLKDKKINTTQKKAIDTFIDHLCNEYTETISHFGVENKINRMYQKVIKYINISKKVIIIFIMLEIFTLLMINLKKIYKFVSLIGISLSTSGILLIITNIFANAKIKIQTITVLNNAISNILRNIFTEILDIIIKNGTYLVMLGIVLIILSNLVHNIKESKTKENI